MLLVVAFTATMTWLIQTVILAQLRGAKWMKLLQMPTGNAHFTGIRNDDLRELRGESSNSLRAVVLLRIILQKGQQPNLHCCWSECCRLTPCALLFLCSRPAVTGVELCSIPPPLMSSGEAGFLFIWQMQKCYCRTQRAMYCLIRKS